MIVHTGYEKTTYTAKIPDKKGIVHYVDEENHTWAFLIHRQMQTIHQRACESYLKGLKFLELPTDRVPQCREVSEALMQATGWSVHPVPTLIPNDEFFYLLAHRKFPAATFIRRWDEIDYLKEPDIFHEFFGHCPLLTDPRCADFMQHYGKIALQATPEERHYLARLYWFTVEFGLIQTTEGLRIYGGGILSSQEETIYCLEDTKLIRKPFDIIDALRTPYRIDILQPIYFVIQDFSDIYALIELDLLEKIREAQRLGDHAPMFEIMA